MEMEVDNCDGSQEGDDSSSRDSDAYQNSHRFECDLDETIIIRCGEFLDQFDQFSVYTNVQKLNECANQFGAERDSMRSILAEVLQRLNQYTPTELNAVCEAKGDEWLSWCNDFIIFICVQASIRLTPIPIESRDPLTGSMVHSCLLLH